MQTSPQLLTGLRLSPQQILTAELLLLSADDLVTRIEAEIQSNPALDWRGEAPTTDWLAADGHDFFLEQTLPTPTSLTDYLLDQLRLHLDETDLALAEEILGCLDPHGWLPETSTELAVRLDAPVERITTIVKRLQTLDPPGIGAYDAREALLLQLDHLDCTDVSRLALARRLLEEGYDDLIHQAWPRLARRLGIRVSEVEALVEFIQVNLTPYPALTHWGEDDNDLRPIPAVIISLDPDNHETGFQVRVVEAERYQLHVPAETRRAASLSSEFGLYIQRARLFMSSLQRRWRTLAQVTVALVEAQPEFVLHGPRRLQPLTQTDLANWLGVHESTISRTVRGKYAQLPNGRIVALTDFFTTDAPVKEALRALIAAEPRPLSDQDLADELNQHGFHISRRTIAKYRTELNIPATHRRLRRARA